MFPYLLPPLILQRTQQPVYYNHKLNYMQLPVMKQFQQVQIQPPKVLPFFPPPVATVKTSTNAYPRTPLKNRDEELDVSEITLSTPVHKRQSLIDESGENCSRPLRVSDQVAKIEDTLKRRKSEGSAPN